MKLPSYVITLLTTLLFVILFFEKSLGLNVAIYGVSTVLVLVTFKTDLYRSLLPKVVSVGLLATSIAYYLFASPFTLFISIVSFLLLFGLHTLAPVRNLLFAVPNVIVNYFASIGDFFSAFKARKKNGKTLRITRILRVVGIPLFIVFLFVSLYSMGSSFFSDAMSGFFTFFNDILSRITKYIDVMAVMVGVLGFIFAVLHSLKPKKATASEHGKTDTLFRVKNKFKKRFKFTDLNTELNAGVFLLGVLSLLLGIVLFLEIKNVWFGFEWNGELLKEFVHEGTYILIFAILLSMAVTLYYFRKNLNFHSKNIWLKRLAYTWLALNLLLVVSVFVRNSLYIEYFGLAYKRIGVVFFLVLCIVGLVSIFIKISKVKSTYYITRVNSLAAYVTLVVLCLFNWDVIIAKHNFKHYKESFVHLPFMVKLSDKALPYLKISDEMAKEIEEKQVENIPFAKRGYFDEVNYQQRIDARIDKFTKEYKDRHWLESVWAEQRAYILLSK